MKIVKASFRAEELELTRPYTTAYENIDCIDHVFVPGLGVKLISDFGSGIAD